MEQLELNIIVGEATGMDEQELELLAKRSAQLLAAEKRVVELERDNKRLRSLLAKSLEMINETSEQIEILRACMAAPLVLVK